MKSMCLSIPILLLVWLTPASGMGADPFMGNWRSQDETNPLLAQVISLGSEEYQININTGAKFPGQPVTKMMGRIANDQLMATGMSGDGSEWQLTATPKEMQIEQNGPTQPTVELKRFHQKSPTLGLAPPPEAVVLFDGSSLDGWHHAVYHTQPTDQTSSVQIEDASCRWILPGDGSMQVNLGGVVTERTFQDVLLHVEFQTPYEPEQRGQMRGNSGVYLQGRYEVQVLDSYGLEGTINECGAVYNISAPSVNMCAPPVEWQTYDILFRAPRFDSDGNLTEQARISVLHNGVLVQENVSIPGPTPGAVSFDIAQPGGIHLQDHGNPVRYRNIWAVEQDSAHPEEIEKFQAMVLK